MSASPKSLLGFTADLQSLSKGSQGMLDSDTVRRLEKAVEALKRLNESYSSEDRRQAADRMDTLHAFWGRIESPRELLAYFGNLRMARKLAWVLTVPYKKQSPIAGSTYLRFALEIIAHHMTAGALLGLFDALLQHWDQPQTAERIRQIVSGEVDRYDGKRQSIHHLKENKSFLIDASGATQWAGFLLANPVSCLFGPQILFNRSQGQAVLLRATTISRAIAMKRKAAIKAASSAR